jgi:uncharacterized membrane protein
MATPRALNIVLLIIFIIIFIGLIIPRNNKTKKTKYRAGNSPLTKEKLRSYNGLANITDEEAENIICSLKKYSELTYKMFIKKHSNPTI